MSNTIIRIKELKREFTVGSELVRALKGVDVSINKNEYVAMMGPSGSGKSTLMNLLGCLDTPTSGAYNLNGTDVSSLEDNDLARIRNKEIGFIFQTYNLLPVYSVYENVLFPLLLNGSKEKDARERVMNIVSKVGLSDQIKKKPSQLSGGQCQRVAIARALVKDPLLILADEPTANLDSKNSLQILELMSDLNEQYKAAVVFSTHDEKVTRYVRREVGLEDGEIISDKQ